MKKILEKNNLLRPPRVGEIIEGKVVNKGKASVFLDLGSWGTGIIYGKEFYEARSKLKSLKTGDSVFTKITDLENEEGYIELSLSKARKELDDQQQSTGKSCSFLASDAHLGRMCHRPT